MDTLPLESLQRIFELACTDGGYTGSTLSFVSRGIRTAARTTRFHSVSLVATPHRLQSFVNLYKRECDLLQDSKPRIQHLYVEFPSIELKVNTLHPSSPAPANIPEHPGDGYVVVTFPNPSENPPGAIADTPRCRTAVMQQWTSRRRTSLDGSIDFRHDLSHTSPEYCSDSVAPIRLSPTTHGEYLSAARTLFWLVAPNLSTLVVQSGISNTGQLGLPVIERPFYNLREATCVGVTDFRALLIEPDATRAAPVFPTMTRLHLVPPDGRGLSLSFWSTHAPCVEYLCVTHAERHVEEIGRTVGVRLPKPRTALRGTAPGWGRMSHSGDLNLRWNSPSLSPPEPPPAPTYPSVHHLMLEPSLGSMGAACGNDQERYGEQIERLRQMEFRCMEIGVEAVEAEAPTDGHFHNDCERARLQWLKRVGGQG